MGKRSDPRWRGGPRLAALAATLAMMAAGCNGAAVTTPRPSVPGVLGSSIAGAAGSSSNATGSASVQLPRRAQGTACGVTSYFFARETAPQEPDPSLPETRVKWNTPIAAFGLKALTLSPDGKLVAVAGGSGATAFAEVLTDEGLKVAELPDPGSIVCLAWSPDGRTVAGGATDGKVRVWKVDGRLLRVLPGSDPIQSLAWSPGGELLATAAIHFPPAAGLVDLPGVVKTWTQDGSPVRTLATRLTGGKFLNLGWSPDGAMLAAGAMDYRVWLANGDPVGVPREAGTPSWAMAWSPDGAAVALGDENGVLETVAPAGPSVQLHHFQSGVNDASYSPDGHYLAIGLGDQLVVVRADDISESVWAVPATAPQAIWSPDSLSLLALGGHGLVAYRATGGAIATLTGCPGNVTGYGWTGTVAVAVTDAGRLCGWAVQNS